MQDSPDCPQDGANLCPTRQEHSISRRLLFVPDQTIGNGPGIRKTAQEGAYGTWSERWRPKSTRLSGSPLRTANPPAHRLTDWRSSGRRRSAASSGTHLHFSVTSGPCLSSGSSLVRRTIYPEVPPRVEYALTPLGRTLIEPVSALSAWALAHSAEIEHHRASSIAAIGNEASGDEADRTLQGI
ncbi:MAG: transcriptional regulator [Chloroflexi bacterium]|nr:transcriptional regulator [Chloroflexota bacterium]